MARLRAVRGRGRRVVGRAGVRRAVRHEDDHVRHVRAAVRVELGLRRLDRVRVRGAAGALDAVERGEEVRRVVQRAVGVLVVVRHRHDRVRRRGRVVVPGRRRRAAVGDARRRREDGQADVGEVGSKKLRKVLIAGLGVVQVGAGRVVGARAVLAHRAGAVERRASRRRGFEPHGEHAVALTWTLNELKPKTFAKNVGTFAVSLTATELTGLQPGIVEMQLVRDRLGDRDLS